MRIYIAEQRELMTVKRGLAMTNPTPQRTDFAIDVLGRYVCNGLDEATASADSVRHPDARPFDFIIVGGGSFGSVLACHLFLNDLTHAHRILVLEAGPFALPEHVQNLPPPLGANEVWGVPWASDSPAMWNQQFPGLAFCLGGRSLFWGGWSPYLIDSELPTGTGNWPANVKRDLTTAAVPPGNPTRSYLDEAADQIGTSATNDFVYGALHDALRDRLFAGLTSRSGNLNPALGGNVGTKFLSPPNAKADLEAPLAVQSAPSRPGFFPFNKFNGVQLLVRAARLAQSEAEQSAVGDAETISVKKRLMIVPNAHVIGLERNGRKITRVNTNQGTVDVVDGARVFLALGTIENTRIALATLPNANGLIGRNLMAHLRSNLTIRIPRASFGPQLDIAAHPDLRELQVSALFVKGIYKHANGQPGHFHFQITASGVGELGTNSEAELFKKIPDIDTLERFNDLTDKWIVVTLRGIGEMVGDQTSSNPTNRVTLDRVGPQGAFDYGVPRALVRLEGKDPNDPAGRNMKLWDAMDAAAEEIAKMFGGNGPIQYLSSQNSGVWLSSPPPLDARRDALSSTHHESGTLWMGTDPATSVTDEFGRFHEADNLYAVGPALLPRMGSPNPMLSGVALTRRTADALVRPAAAAAESGFNFLFDGTERTFSLWRPAGRGAFALIDGCIVAEPGDGLGLLYYAAKPFSDFVLRFEMKLSKADDNSGIFLRFRDPTRDVPDPASPQKLIAYDNKAWVGVDTGFEVQIDEIARPDNMDKHRTGAIYNIETGFGAGKQTYKKPPTLSPGTWTEWEIAVAGDQYTVRLKDGGVFKDVTSFTNTDQRRGKSAATDPLSGFLGLQAHTGNVAFRNIRIR